MSRFCLSVLLMILSWSSINAQGWYQMHLFYDDCEWLFPVRFQDVSFFDFDKGNSVVKAHLKTDEDIVVPFKLKTTNSYDATADGITLSNSLQSWGKDKYRTFAIYVTTDDGSDISSKTDYVHCYVSIGAMREYPDNSLPANIRGRGNSTWEWYAKKPYRIKFDQSSKLLGINKNKDWVLLANYRDITKMMNTFCSVTADWMGLPFTTAVRFAELFINGEYKGIYQIAEQVEVGGGRVAIDPTEGLLLTLDVDDGPTSNPGDNNFWTEVYNMPMQVKSPKELTAEQLADVKAEFGELEKAIKAHNYKQVDSLLDIDSYIRMIQLQEYVYNVELSAPRSVFLFRDKGGKFTFGPAWDWDAGFDFRWSDMYTGHTYFQSYTKTLLGTRPYDRNGDYKCPRFFTDMFGNGQFVKHYKELWNNVSADIFKRNWDETQHYIDALNSLQKKKTQGYSSPYVRDSERWPANGFNFSTEIEKMKKWLKNRLDFLNPVIEAYPEPDDTGEIEIPDEYSLVGTIKQEYSLQYNLNYSQNVQVKVDKTELARLFGVDAATLTSSTLDLVPLNYSDGTEGTNTAAKNYGAWFDDQGDTNAWEYGHVYIESNDLFTLNCGCHPDNCYSGDTHTVLMQYRHHEKAKAVNLQVKFTIEGGGWWW